MPLYQMHESLSAMRIEDFLLAPFYLLGIFLIARYIKKTNEPSPVAKYVYPALGIRLFSGFMFALVYQFVYGGKTVMGGDTGTYFQGGLAIYKSLFYNPKITWELLFIKELHLKYDNYIYSAPWWGYFDHRKSFEQLFMYRFSFFPILLGLGTYLGATFMMSLFIFLGTWKVYKIFCNKYPGLEKQFAIAFFFIPSMCFWGSGLMRDTASLACLMWLFYFAHNIFILRKNIIISLIAIFFFGRLIFLFKAYIILTFIPAALLWYYLINIRKVQNAFLRLLFGFFLLVTLSGVGYLALVNMANSSEKYALDNLEKQLSGFHSYHSYLSDKGISKSGYSLHIEDYSAIGILKVLPAAINVSLFRPYPWESRSPFILLSALESFAVFIFVLRLIWRVGPLRLFKYLKIPEVALGLTYAVILGTACGISAFNFGALVRFKIPFLPFFFSALFLMEHFAMIDKKKREEKRAQELPPPNLSPAIS